MRTRELKKKKKVKTHRLLVIFHIKTQRKIYFDITLAQFVRRGDTRGKKTCPALPSNSLSVSPRSLAFCLSRFFLSSFFPKKNFLLILYTGRDVFDDRVFRQPGIVQQQGKILKTSDPGKKKVTC